MLGWHSRCCISKIYIIQSEDDNSFILTDQAISSSAPDGALLCLLDTPCAD